MEGKVKIFRFNPVVDTSPFFEEYEFDYSKGMTVLDILNLIREKYDPTLSYSYCCRNGHCGLCGIKVNNKEVLSCKHPAETNMEIMPLGNLMVLKDLVINREEYEVKRPQLRLFLERQCEAHNEPECIDMEKFNLFKTASRCIECLCCVSVCPAYKEKPHLFAGPMAFSLLARHYFDPRDNLNRGLLARSEGIEHCIECNLCSKRCVLGVNPAELIKLMKIQRQVGTADRVICTSDNPH
jgi:succinate dehydrogenase/fumarate reductase iron-sulfur protein